MKSRLMAFANGELREQWWHLRHRNIGKHDNELQVNGTWASCERNWFYEVERLVNCFRQLKLTLSVCSNLCLLTLVDKAADLAAATV